MAEFQSSSDLNLWADSLSVEQNKGIRVAKANIYSVLGAPTGISVAKANIYSVVVIIEPITEDPAQ